VFYSGFQHSHKNLQNLLTRECLLCFNIIIINRKYEEEKLLQKQFSLKFPKAKLHFARLAANNGMLLGPFLNCSNFFRIGKCKGCA
jgi:hypothetical protein